MITAIPSPLVALATSRAVISSAYRADEAACVAALISELRDAAPDRAAVEARARDLVVAVRRQRSGASGVDHLMHQFALSSQEGIALMCLAEALLRIPDTATMDLLIRDKISRGDWRAHLGRSQSMFVNATTWGLMITGRLVSTVDEESLANTLTRAIARGGEPMIRKSVEFAMKLLGEQFVMGETIETALARSEDNVRKGYSHSFDMLGEAALTMSDADRYFTAYESAIHAIGRSRDKGSILGPGISVKLSALHPRYSRAQRGRVLTELYPRLLALAALARDYEIGLSIDAEEAERLELSLDLIDRLAFEPTLAGWPGLGVVVQAYQKRAPAVIDHLALLAKLSGRRMMLRLVKGAYWDSEIKRAQVDGQAGYPVFTRKVHTDLCYLVCARRLLEAADAIYPQFATHNAHTLAGLERMAADLGVTEYEFQCLHGMGEALYDNVVAKDRLCRIYAPVGQHETLLHYLVRRLLENGANSSFVNRIVDEKVSVDELVGDPLAEVQHLGGAPHPAIPLPADIYGNARRNSAGIDLTDEPTLARLESALAALADRRWNAEPLLSEGTGTGGLRTDITNPACRDDIVGNVREASPADIGHAVDAAHAFAPEWHATPPAERARLLRAGADRLEAESVELVSLCMREAGKTRGNAVAEIREAVDFCRYYANEIEKLPTAGIAVPGPVVAISPWNFPVAIFAGEVVAALAAGSPVLAKPAEQTPLAAARVVELLREAGVPPAALQFLPGRGETVGAALVADARVRGVVFTGSTEVARIIYRKLATRPGGDGDARLIAETGGQNAMIVDSSALPEQVVQDVIASGFDSAGQRCSALRVLCLQDDIADSVLAMLRSAMRELAVGDPAELATDVGPVIDEEARAGIEAHIAEMRRAGRSVSQCALPDACAKGSFVPPTLVEIASIAELRREVFGPVVHVLRFAAADLDQVVEAINATGYGLTFGIHSRIDATIARVTGRIRAGNRYVNRNMIGAVVGVQPFGGEGKSGTGPKAGGPFYLPRLMDLANPPLARLGLERPTQADNRLAPFEALTAWAHRQGMRELALACAEYAVASPLLAAAELPGPTGESNTLSFAPRGDVLCRAASEPAFLDQLAAVLATGNAPVVPTDIPPAALVSRLPGKVAEGIRWMEPEDAFSAAAVLFEGDDEAFEAFRAALAKHGESFGTLVPVIRGTATPGRYPLYRLLHERVQTVNTTAAGGNTTLMTLAA